MPWKLELCTYHKLIKIGLASITNAEASEDTSHLT